MEIRYPSYHTINQKDSPKGVYINEESDRITIGVNFSAITIKGIIVLLIGMIVIGFMGYFIFGGFLPVIKNIANSGCNIWANPAIYFFIFFASFIVFIFGAWLISVIMGKKAI